MCVLYFLNSVILGTQIKARIIIVVKYAHNLKFKLWRANGGVLRMVLSPPVTAHAPGTSPTTEEGIDLVASVSEGSGSNVTLTPA